MGTRLLPDRDLCKRAQLLRRPGGSLPLECSREKPLPASALGLVADAPAGAARSASPDLGQRAHWRESSEVNSICLRNNEGPVSGLRLRPL